MGTIDLVLNKEYAGPTLLELAASIPDIAAAVIDLKWLNSKDELRLLADFPNRDFKLHILTPEVFDRATAVFGKRLKISKGLIDRARLTLNDPNGYDWRHFIEELPEASPRNVLLKLVADGLRKGKQPLLATIMDKFFVDGTNVADADVLLRLKSGRIRG